MKIKYRTAERQKASADLSIGQNDLPILDPADVDDVVDGKRDVRVVFVEELGRLDHVSARRLNQKVDRHAFIDHIADNAAQSVFGGFGFGIVDLADDHVFGAQQNFDF